MILSDFLLPNKVERFTYAAGKTGKSAFKRETPQVTRIRRDLLEALYRQDPIIFNSINKITQLALTAGYSLYCKEANNLRGKEAINKIQGFIDNVGYYTGELNWMDLLEKSFKSTCIFGGSYWEQIFDTTTQELIDVGYIDPKVIDFARDTSGNIVTDSYKNPVGYFIIYSSYSFGNQMDVVPPPKEVSRPSGVTSIYIPADIILYSPVNLVGDCFEGIGLVEPIYKVSLAKMDAEAGFANAAHRLGNPLLYGSVGDQVHEPSESMLNDTVTKLEDVTSRNVFALPYYAKLDIVESRQTQWLRSFLDYWNDMQIAGLGIPSAFATGSGTEVNRSILERQEYITKLTIKNNLYSLSNNIERYIFDRITRFYKLPSVGLKWGEIVLEELDSRAVRLSAYAKAGLIKPTLDVENNIRDAEHLNQITQDDLDDLKIVNSKNSDEFDNTNSDFVEKEQKNKKPF